MITEISGTRLFYKISLPTIHERQLRTGYIGHKQSCTIFTCSPRLCMGGNLNIKYFSSIVVSLLSETTEDFIAINDNMKRFVMGLYENVMEGKESELAERQSVCERERGRAYEKEGSSIGTKIIRFT